MGERKVQAKYYPPDFDPSKLPRIKKKRQNDDAVRFMLPMSVRCDNCGEFMGTGLKFNARKSDTDENYLGIRIFRFSMKCKSCPSTFYIKTDPKNSDYVCEKGVRRNYEPWRAAKGAEEEAKDERARQDEDSIQALENKTKDAIKEMDDLDALDELKTLKAKQSKLNVDDVLASGRALEEQQNREAEQRMRREAKNAFERKRNTLQTIESVDGTIGEVLPKPKISEIRAVQQEGVLKTAPRTLKVVKKIKKVDHAPSQLKSAINRSVSLGTTEASGLVDYGSSSGSDED